MAAPGARRTAPGRRDGARRVGGAPRHDGVRAAALTALSVLGALLVGELDHRTQRSLSFVIFYVVVVLGAAHLGTVRVGLVAAAAAAASWGAADLAARSPHRWGVVDVWNLSTRFLVLALLVVLVTRMATLLEGARASDRRTRAFLADAAHQLRTPVAAMRASSEALLMAPASPAQEDLLANIAAESARVGRLVSGLLRLARLDAGDGPARAVVDPVALCESEADRLPALRDLAVTVVATPDVPRSLVAGEDALREAVANLLHNAGRHARSSVDVRLSVEGDELAISVIDDGPGLPPGVEEHVFERFVSLDDRGGSGLGLPIARALVRGDGGDVGYRDGAFRIVLPVRRSPHARRT